MTHYKLAFIFLLLVSFRCESNNKYVWLIGGGNIINNSQEQIEKNVLWIDGQLKKINDTIQYKLYYGIGEEPGNDIIFTNKNTTKEKRIIQTVFNKNAENEIAYRRHKFQLTNGTTNKNKLSDSLAKDFSEVKKNSELLIIYNGHGGRKFNHEDDNYLKLWNDTRINTTELSSLIKKAPNSSVIRFILPQCYSGGFYNLYKDSNQTRCGFMSVSETKEAEGCTLKSNSEEFRDYTSYFFSALSKSSMYGKNLVSDPDTNKDNIVSFREAHIYTLKYAISRDLSRSTSEVYLEKWLPWYLKWDDIQINPDSVYKGIENEVVKYNSLSTNDKELKHNYTTLKENVKKLTSKRNIIKLLIKNYQIKIQRNLKNSFPEIMTDSTDYLDESSNIYNDKFSLYIENLEDYKKLISTIDNFKHISIEKLKTERKLTQIKKIFRLRRLAWLEKVFAKYASDDDKKEYNKLLSCEESGNIF